MGFIRRFVHAGLFLAILAAAAPAATMSFTVTGSAYSDPLQNGSGSSGAVSARVDFVITAGHIDVKIYNLQTGITKDIQTISGINFTLSEIVSSASISSRTGTERYVCKAPNNPAGCTQAGGYFAGSTTWTHWTLVKDTTPAAIVNGLPGAWDLSAFDGGNPTHTIIGAPTSGTNLYSSGGAFPNNSIVNHEPLLFSDASTPIVFGLDMIGLSVSATITNVKIFFGTDRTAPCPGGTCQVMPSVPEPGTWATGGLALVALACCRRRLTSRRRAATPFPAAR